MSFFTRKLSFIGLLLMLIALSGCGTEANQTGESTSEIQAYMDANPDQVNRPEDAPPDEADEFAAGGI